MSQEDLSPEIEELEAPPPSVRLDTPLIDSYTYHSCEGHAAFDDTEYIMGIDEAGRGPVLGPQVYSVAFCRTTFVDQLKEMGFADSKTLTHEKRLELLSLICSCPDDLKWAVRVMSPADISKGMLKKTPYNLNAQSHDATTLLIQSILDKGFKLTHVYVDTVGPTDAYHAKLSAAFPTLQFTVESKADFKYPIVGAASIAAKVTRDACMSCWTYMETNAPKKALALGSGYPSDPRTVAWLEENVDLVFGFPNIARFSWATVKNLLEKKAARVDWSDEPPKIQRFFSTSAANLSRTAMWKELGLSSQLAF